MRASAARLHLPVEPHKDESARSLSSISFPSSWTWWSEYTQDPASRFPASRFPGQGRTRASRFPAGLLQLLDRSRTGGISQIHWTASVNLLSCQMEAFHKFIGQQVSTFCLVKWQVHSCVYIGGASIEFLG